MSRVYVSNIVDLNRNVIILKERQLTLCLSGEVSHVRVCIWMKTLKLSHTSFF
jgi:hypothetical protein